MGMRIASVALWLCVLPLGVVAQAPDGSVNPLLGSWSLMVEESSIDYASLPRREHRTYETAPNNRMVFRVEGIDGAGAEYAYGSTAAPDGNEYPMPGTGTRNGGDSVSWTIVDANTVHAVVKRMGEVVNRVVLAISDDGQVLTITENGTALDETPTHGVRVYERNR